MIQFIKNIKTFLIAAVCIAVVGSCNKDVEQFADVVIPPPSAKGLAATIAANATDSLFYKLVVKAGMVDQLNNVSAGTYTMLVPDNNAMLASGLSNAVVTGMPAANAAMIVRYNVIPQKITSAQIPTAFPNMQLPTMIVLDPSNALVRMTTFLSKNGSAYYVNNIPLGTMDVPAANGVIHKPLRLVAPPSATLKGAIASEGNASLFRVAVTRADEGKSGLERFDSLFNYPVTNMTVLVPDNNAFKGLINYLSAGAVPLTAPDAVFEDFIKTKVPAATIRGMLAYHLPATINAVSGKYEPNIRVFSVNLSATAATFLKTMVNSDAAAALHPGILAQATAAGGLKFTQYPPVPPAMAPFTAPPANAISIDKHAVNGVYHIIDRILLPQ